MCNQLCIDVYLNTMWVHLFQCPEIVVIHPGLCNTDCIGIHNIWPCFHLAFGKSRPLPHRLIIAEGHGCFYYLLAMPEPVKELLFCKHTKKIVWPAGVLLGAIPGSFHVLTLGGRCSHTPKEKCLSWFNISPCLVAVHAMQKFCVHLLAVF